LKIQVALDLIDLDKALKIAHQVSDYVDIIEVGTPLIKSIGLDSVRKLREKFPDKLITADMKIMDVGFMETEMAAKAGANIVSVLAAAPDSTIKESVKAGSDYSVKIMCDLIGINNKIERIKILKRTGVDYVLVHTGIDEQKYGKDPLQTLKKIAEVINSDIKIAVAGGIDDKCVRTIKNLNIDVDIIIVGSFITMSRNPKEAAKRIHEEVMIYGKKNNE